MLRHLTPATDPHLLVGADTGDDAAIWRLDDERALVATADFITPVVDDARAWGGIAAANSASDVYAMGGRPLFALNLVGWNVDELSIDLLGEVLAGGDDIAREGAFVVAGGHTVDDPEPKYGMAVIGEVHPDRLLTNAGLAPDQELVLSKPLGVGIITTAVKADAAPDDVRDAAVASMCRLNAEASIAALGAGATGCTDVTGFGLLGHLGRMLLESAVDAEIDCDAVPVLDGTSRLAAEGLIPGGTRRNLAWAEPRLDPGSRDQQTRLVLADAQTSGGLVFGVPSGRGAGVVADLAATGHSAAVIGHTLTGAGTIHLR